MRNFLLVPEEFPHIVDIAFQDRSQALDRGGTHQTRPRHHEDALAVWLHFWGEWQQRHPVLGAASEHRMHRQHSIYTEQPLVCLTLFLPTLNPKPDSSASPQLHPIFWGALSMHSGRHPNPHVHIHPPYTASAMARHVAGWEAEQNPPGSGFKGSSAGNSTETQKKRKDVMRWILVLPGTGSSRASLLQLKRKSWWYFPWSTCDNWGPHKYVRSIVYYSFPSWTWINMSVYAYLAWWRNMKRSRLQPIDYSWEMTVDECLEKARTKAGSLAHEISQLPCSIENQWKHVRGMGYGIKIKSIIMTSCYKDSNSY